MEKPQCVSGPFTAHRPMGHHLVRDTDSCGRWWGNACVCVYENLGLIRYSFTDNTGMELELFNADLVNS